MTFDQTVKSWNLRYFSAGELLFKGASNARLENNTDPPESLWDDMRETALAADEARVRLDVPISIISAYRSPAYNRAVGGVSSSQHMKFTALDLKPKGKSAKALYDVLLEMRRDGFFKGGLGRYSSFTHIDTRGKNATWTGS